MNLIEWNHPRRGRISEVACPAHESQILAALRLLAIGCVGSPAEPGATCLRCKHAHERPMVFLPGNPL